MTIASLLLALLTATSAPASDSSRPVLLDFHAEWCGPCRKARPAVEQLVRKGYPIKTIDIDQEPALRERYHVEAVPTFIVVDASGRELDRTSGPQLASELARFYKAAAAKAQPPVNSNAHVGSRENTRAAADDDDDHDRADAHARPRPKNDDDRPEEDDQDRDEPPFSNPKPWETVVRIRVLSNHATGFGSGTVIHSTPEESLILTCGHIFKLEGRRQVAPADFPRRIMVDLFDGNLQGTKPAKVHFVEAVQGWAVDYDFKRDVGLIRIRPKRRLPACRVVPAYWEPQSRMRVLTVGCSEGHDATAWFTVINRPRIQNFLSGNSTYEAIECEVAPKQGRSGGGLFTTDGYIAGVCNFAEPQGNHGLYATPRSIYSLLDRNKLVALYAPVSNGSSRLIADRGPAQRSRKGAPVSVARSQSPDTDEPDRTRASGDDGDVIVPHPHLLNIADPVAVTAETSPRAGAGTTRRTAWQPHAIPAERKADKMQLADRAQPTDLNLDPRADHDHFGPPPADADAAPSDGGKTDETSASNSILPASPPSKSRWRAVKASVEQNSATAEK
jgi:thiol-disulfide isomerase/thioredoxin